MIKNLLLVGLGGGIGSMLRYLVSLLINKYSFLTFPFATFVVNMSGCLLIGLLLGLSEKYSAFNSELRYLLVIGLCGGYTTFSTFSAENVQLLENGNYLIFGLYALGSVSVGLFALWLGYMISKII